MNLNASSTIDYFRTLIPGKWARFTVVILLWTLFGSLSAIHWRFFPAGNYPYGWWELYEIKLILWYAFAVVVPLILSLGHKYALFPATWRKNAVKLFLWSLVITLSYLVVYTLLLIIYLPPPISLERFFNMFGFVMKAHSTFYYLAFWGIVGLEHSITFYLHARFERSQKESVLSRYPSYGLGNGSIRHLPVKTSRKLIMVPVDEIDWIESADYCVSLHCNGKTHIVRKTMHWLERQLDPDKFIRIHRKFIVNVERIIEVHSGNSGRHGVVLSSGVNLEMSRRRRSKLDRLLRHKSHS